MKRFYLITGYWKETVITMLYLLHIYSYEIEKRDSFASMLLKATYGYERLYDIYRWLYVFICDCMRMYVVL